MQLIDKYTSMSCNFRYLSSYNNKQSFLTYTFTNQIKKRLILKYHPSYISVIHDNKEQSGNFLQTTVAVIFNKLSHQKFDFHIFISFNLQIQLIQIQGFLCLNGIPISVQSFNRITFCINISSNLNQLISPIKICLNPKTGSLYLQANVFTQKISRQQDEGTSEIVNKIIHLITLIEQNKYFLLYLLQQKMNFNQSFLSLYPSIATRLQQAQFLISSLQGSLFTMNLDIFDKNNSINYDLKRHQFCLNYQPLSQQISGALSLFSPNLHVQSSSKISKLSNQQYFDFQIQNYKDIISRKIHSQILTRVYLHDQEQWINWRSLSSGGYGKIQVADVKIYLPQADNYPNFDNNTQIDLLQVTILRKSDRRKIKESRVVHQKEIVKKIKNKAHPNIATFLQVIPKEKKNLSFSQLINFLQNQRYIYLLYEVNTSLDSFMRKNQCFSLYSKIFTLQQAAKGLLFLHKQKIVHIDFKPANIFIGKHCLAKIGDFGQSLHLGSPQFYNNATTFPYSPPEYNKQEPFLLTQKADVYSFGVTLFQCLFESNVKKPMQQRYSLRNNSGNSYIELPYIQPQRIKQYGNQRVISILSFLCLRCINLQSRQRPSMAWVVTILQYCRFYLDLLMSK